MSTKQNLNISPTIYPDSQILSEIEWIENKIKSLKPKLERKPRTQREINDLLRQIEDRKKVLEFRLYNESGKET